MLKVRNFGVAGATAQKFADQPYWEDVSIALIISHPLFGEPVVNVDRSGNLTMCECLELMTSAVQPQI